MRKNEGNNEIEEIIVFTYTDTRKSNLAVSIIVHY
jgi:hypothetical protein